MPSNPKVYERNQVRELTTSIQKGLPFLANNLIKNITLAVMARALELFPVTICSFLVMGNHIHFITIVQNALSYASFIDYFKTNTALAINKLMGIPKGSVWEKGTDSPAILDLESLIDRLVYLYVNPIKANVVNNIYEYGNLNTFNVLKNKNGIIKIKAYKIKRTDVPTINQEQEENDPCYYKKLFNIVFGKKKVEYEMTINLRASYDALSHTSDITFEEFENKVIEKIQEVTKKFQEERQKEKKPLLGNVKSIFTNYIPTKRVSHKMICLAKDVERRKEYIERFRYLVSLAREAYQEWKKNNTIKYYPIGFFLPPHPPLGIRESIFT